MKQQVVFVVVLVLVSCVCPAQNADTWSTGRLPCPPKGYRWQIIESLTDEFAGDALDESKWLAQHPYWSGRNSTHTPSNVSVRDGNLRLLSTLRAGATEVKASTVTAACVASTTARCGPGYYEARIKCSDISMTSAFWLQGKYSEIDVIENIGNASEPNSVWINQTMMTNTHYFKGGWDKDRKTPFNWKMPSPSSAEYHVYAVWWKDQDTVASYHNGQLIKDVTTGGPFDEKQYMFFDTEVFTLHGWPTKASLLDPNKNTMLVDWVRAWQLAREEGAATDSLRPDDLGNRSTDGWQSLFNTRDLTGWSVQCPESERAQQYWQVKDGVIECNSLAGGRHDYHWLMSEQEFGDFHLRLKFQIFQASKGNSGLQFRSRYDTSGTVTKGPWLHGPQVDIHPPMPLRTGLIYDETWETRRWIHPSLPNSRIVPEKSPAAAHQTQLVYADDDPSLWNALELICQGTKVKTLVNGLLVADFNGAGVLDDEAHQIHKVGLKGYLALQLHRNDKILIRFKDILIKEL